jgi:hypothetical protein
MVEVGTFEHHCFWVGILRFKVLLTKVFHRFHLRKILP